jgi:hypoxanthine phosphoribosyltransferase
MMEKDISEILLTGADIQAKVAELGARITADYQGKNLILVGVLKGSVVFMADLMRAVDLPLSIDFMVVSSYGGGTKTSGVVRIIKDIERPLDDLDVLIVEDILDSGMTLSYLREIIAQKGAKSVRIATLLDKPERRVVKEIVPDYVGFTIPDAFVVGYGLDYDERYRNLPYVGILSPTVYE